MPLTDFNELDFAGRRVLLRSDLNAALTPAGGVADRGGLEAALPTMRHILERGGRLVVCGHLDSPAHERDRVEEAPSMEAIGLFLAERLGQDVRLTDEPEGDGAKKVVSDLRDGEIAVLENLLRARGETRAEDALARGLANYGEIYINDSCESLHLALSSTSGVARHVKNRAPGLRLRRYLDVMDRFQSNVEHPFVALVGGGDFAGKIEAIEGLLKKVDVLMVAGAVGNTFLRAKGGKLGRSLVEEDKLVTARSLLKKANDHSVKVILPVDAVAAAGLQAGDGLVLPANNIPDSLAALDIGPETLRIFSEQIERARSVFWTGPVGAFEAPAFSTGSIQLAKNMSKEFSPLRVAAGYATSECVKRAEASDRFTLVTQAGASSLAFLQGRELPGLIALQS